MGCGGFGSIDRQIDNSNYRTRADDMDGKVERYGKKNTLGLDIIVLLKFWMMLICLIPNGSSGEFLK